VCVVPSENRSARILKVTADGTATSPVIRGLFVNERILGTHIPPPPPGVPANRALRQQSAARGVLAELEFLMKVRKRGEHRIAPVSRAQRLGEGVAARERQLPTSASRLSFG